MNLYLDSTQVESLRNCYETMRHSFPTQQFVFAPVLLPAGDPGAEWPEGNYEVHWPIYDEDGIAVFVYVTGEGELVTTDANPDANCYHP